MTPEQFCYWLQGHLEMSGVTTLGEKEVQILKDHLDLVFQKKTPEYWSDLNQQPICSPLGSGVASGVATVSSRAILDLPVAVSC